MASQVRPNERAGTYPDGDGTTGRSPFPRSIPSGVTPPRTPPRTRSNLPEHAERIGARGSRVVDFIRDLFTPRRDSPELVAESTPQRGIAGSTIRSPINSRTTLGGDADLNQDLIQFYIKDTTNNRILQFQCTVSGIAENISAEWSSHKYIGRPYQSHVYTGVSRDVSFNFEVYPIDSRDLKVVWRKINYMKGLAFPAQYVQQDGSKFMTPPYVELTIGDLYKQQPGFFTSIVMTVNDESPWETGERVERTENTAVLAPTNGPKVPHIVSFQCSFTILERRLLHTGDDLSRKITTPDGDADLARDRFIEETEGGRTEDYAGNSYSTPTSGIDPLNGGE